MEKLRKNPQWKEIPVLFMTGRSDEKLFSDAGRTDALDILYKPIVPSVLLGTVNKYITNTHMEKNNGYI